MSNAVSEVLLEGYPTASILLGLQDTLLLLNETADEGTSAGVMEDVSSGKLSDITKALICEKIAQCEKNLLDGGSELLQLQDLGAFIQRNLQSGGPAL